MSTSRDPKTRAQTWCVAVAIVAAVLLAYLPLHEAGFINYDDDVWLTGNPRVRSGLTQAGVTWAFTTFQGGNWLPLTWLSHQLDWTLFGANPLGHHLVNLALHVANALLLFSLLRRLTGTLWRSALVAALFALHPIHVESVAWVTERKDLLCACFTLLAASAYRSCVSRPAGTRCAATVALHALSLAAKPMSVTLPILLLILDSWPLGRWRIDGSARPGTRLRLVVEKMPLLLLSASASALALVAQRTAGAMQFGEAFPAGTRVANAVCSLGAYLGQTLWPAGLAVFYPYRATIPGGAIAATAVLLAAISLAAWWFRHRAPMLLMGWLWYLVMLSPVLGLVQVGQQARADRYTYLGLTGIFLAATWGLGAITGLSRSGARAAPAVACALLAACGALTWRQAGFWRDSVSLFTHTLAVTAENFPAHNNLGAALYESGRPEDAKAQFEATLRINPEHFNARANLAVILLEGHKYAAAADQFQKLLAVQPRNFRLHVNLGNALLGLGRVEEALRHNEQAVLLAPESPEAQRSLARARGLFAQRSEVGTPTPPRR